MSTIPLTTQRLREMEDWEARNPPESGVVRVTRDPHGRFWAHVHKERHVHDAVNRLVKRVWETRRDAQ